MSFVKDHKRTILVIAACLLVAIACIGGAVAYLTDTETTTNTFTIGEITIDTLEPNWPGNGSDETIDIVAMEEINKDPQIKNTGKNRAIVWMEVDIPMANVITTDDEGNRNEAENLELFEFRTDDGEYNSVDVKWVLLTTTYLNDDGESCEQSEATTCRRLYGYNTVLEEDETTNSVFDVVRLINIVEDQLDNTTQEIVVTSYAIQADNITELTSADWNETMDQSTLLSIYNVYFNQSGDIVSDDADSNNNQTLKNSTLNIQMSVDNSHLKLNTGDEADKKTVANVKMSYTGSGTAPSYTFSSSDEDVVIVDGEGNITAVSVGSAVVTVEAVNPDNGKTVSASVTIQVRDVNAE